jgi:uncharacterized protein YbaR (Trm112 family)
MTKSARQLPVAPSQEGDFTLMTDASFRAILVCPVDHAPLRDVPDALECTNCRRRYPILDNIPNMIPAEITGEKDAEVKTQDQ